MNAPVRSPFVAPAPKTLAPEKFRDPRTTAKGEPRAHVQLQRLETLWFNTGTLCNLTCANCYIESSPTNDALAYLTSAEVEAFLDEIEALGLQTREIGFTGGEPFMNREIIAMIGAALERGYDTLVLTNAMKPMRRFEAGLKALKGRHGDKLTVRVSLDHYTAAVHEAERGEDTWDKTLDGLIWLAREGLSLAVAGRHLPEESDADARAGYARLLAELGVPVDAADPGRLVLFPEMDARVDVPEITEACWGILHKSPSDVMCASSRMVVKRRGADEPVVVACTLTPYDPGFELGPSLKDALGEVALNHPHCAKFCVLGGASCSAR
ncbi:radical SAM protein [Caulobacter sp. 17J80-11]|uniref:radical SAM protein n=1 Tax=Caulobacter sp. 17J80-11 TaxID=2763502 RepID=UPI0016536D93|nr:radical SAM protein [Caulobacter sp. 17J80-11]MBC6981519.1 radical SAM protein [Caulobacter sp. 17J80-11]